MVNIPTIRFDKVEDQEITVDPGLLAHLEEAYNEELRRFDERIIRYILTEMSFRDRTQEGSQGYTPEVQGNRRKCLRDVEGGSSDATQSIQAVTTPEESEVGKDDGEAARIIKGHPSQPS